MQAATFRSLTRIVCSISSTGSAWLRAVLVSGCPSPGGLSRRTVAGSGRRTSAGGAWRSPSPFRPPPSTPPARRTWRAPVCNPRRPEHMPTRVLVVDDEAEVRTAVRHGLELVGYEIEVASDGLEGVSKVESWRPDVVLLDLAMPRMGGLTAIENIRGWSKVPIIVLSVMGEEGDKVRALEAGADDDLTK